MQLALSMAKTRARRAGSEPQIRIVAIGGSADGFKSLTTILGALPPDFPAAVVITQHRRRGRVSVLAGLLARHCELPVKEAAKSEALRPSVVYLAPPDHHLIIEDHHLSVTEGPPVNFSRPSIDVTFDSVATRCGERAIGVVLSGGGRDGARGLRKIKDAGGVTIVQDPDEARVSAMPRSALAAHDVDYRLPVAEIGPMLIRLVTESAEDDGLQKPAPHEAVRA